jgi:pimeloyl-ACP methyl ester carboxylesterase/DNA-binding CsgD family transcriptional regulator
MEREIRFLPVSGRRLAYEVRGAGPPLVVPAWWVGHLELEWQDERCRGFWRSLADGYTLVRYDRLGAGLSDRRVDPAELTLDHDVETLLALLDGLELDRVTLVSGSSGGCTAIALAARHPERVERLVLFGAYASGSELAPPQLRDALVSVVGAHWGLGARVLADVFLPGADDAERDRFARFQREAASPEAAAQLLGLVYRLDVTGELAGVRAPALVLHRREDTAIPYEQGRVAAAAIPGATFVPLSGGDHFPWHGDAGAVVHAIRGFLRHGSPAYAADGAPSPLTGRELDVLHLLAQGLSDGEIAARLIVSPHTVHRHVANIRRKLGRGTRTGAVAEAARLGLL